MDLINCTLHLDGNRNFALPKKEISVAEAVLLRHLHGQDSVVDITMARTTTRSLREEHDRLMAAYGGVDARKEVKAGITAMFQNVHMQGLERIEDLLPAEDRIPRGKKSAAKGVSASDLPGGGGGGSSPPKDGDDPKE